MSGGMNDGKLDTANRFADPDAAFRLIVEAHRGLSEAQSAELNAKLVLILANQVGDVGVLAEALALAAKSGMARPIPQSSS